MRTPEARVKAYAGKRWKQLGAYAFMYVPFGYGQPTLDYLVCLNGRFIGAEAKAPGKDPTPRQYQCMDQIKKAGGIAFWFDSPETFEAALVLHGLTSASAAAAPSQPLAQLVAAPLKSEAAQRSE